MAATLMTSLRKVLVSNYELGRGLTQRIVREMLETQLEKLSSRSSSSSSRSSGYKVYQFCYQPVLECSGRHTIRPRGKGVACTRPGVDGTEGVLEYNAVCPLPLPLLVPLLVLLLMLLPLLLLMLLPLLLPVLLASSWSSFLPSLPPAPTYRDTSSRVQTHSDADSASVCLLAYRAPRQ